MTPTTTTQPVDALPWLDLERELRLEKPRQWAKRFQGASPNEYNRILITLSRHATHRQVARLFQILDRTTIKHEPILAKWRETLLRLSPNIFNATINFQVEHYCSIDYWLSHYVAAPANAKARAKQQRGTIIAFTGSAGLLMAPIPCILAAIAEHHYNLIVVRRSYKTSYFEREGDLLRTISEHLLSIPSLKRHQSIALGTSNGGLAALYTARALRLPLGIAIGAGATTNTLNDGGPLAKANLNLRRPRHKAPWPDKKTRLFLAASANQTTDVESAILVSDYFNTHWGSSSQAKAFFFPECKSHSLPEDLSHKGISLERLLVPFLQSRLSELPQHQTYPFSS